MLPCEILQTSIYESVKQAVPWRRKQEKTRRMDYSYVWSARSYSHLAGKFSLRTLFIKSITWKVLIYELYHVETLDWCFFWLKLQFVMVQWHENLSHCALCFVYMWKKENQFIQNTVSRLILIEVANCMKMWANWTYDPCTLFAEHLQASQCAQGLVWLALWPRQTKKLVKSNTRVWMSSTKVRISHTIDRLLEKSIDQCSTIPFCNGSFNSLWFDHWHIHTRITHASISISRAEDTLILQILLF